MELHSLGLVPRTKLRYPSLEEVDLSTQGLSLDCIGSQLMNPITIKCRTIVQSLVALLLLSFVPSHSGQAFHYHIDNADRYPLAIQATYGNRSADQYRILLFSKTTGFRHGSISDAIETIETLGLEHGFGVDKTENSALFTDENLVQYDAIVWVMTTGDVLNDSEQMAFERYIQAGGGYVGIHSASDTEYDWPWYGDLMGAFFDNHPQIQTATILVEDGAHPSTAHLDATWIRNDEWYNYRSNPRANTNVLMSLDESTYSGGTMGDHPIAWYHEFDGGRAWYTGGGHTSESYSEPDFVQHLLGGIQYAAAIGEAPHSPTATFTSEPQSTSSPTVVLTLTVTNTAPFPAATQTITATGTPIVTPHSSPTGLPSPDPSLTPTLMPLPSPFFCFQEHIGSTSIPLVTHYCSFLPSVW